MLYYMRQDVRETAKMNDRACYLQGPMKGFPCCRGAYNSTNGEGNVQKGEIIISVSPIVFNKIDGVK